MPIHVRADQWMGTGVHGAEREVLRQLVPNVGIEMQRRSGHLRIGIRRRVPTFEAGRDLPRLVEMPNADGADTKRFGADPGNRFQLLVQASVRQELLA